MDNLYLSAIVREMSLEVPGRSVARISQAGLELLIDLRLGNNKMLVASLDTASPAFYISAREQRESNATSTSSTFLNRLQKNLAGAKLLAISKEPLDRMLHLEFEKFGPGGDMLPSRLVLALTGSTTNAYLVGGEGYVEAAFKERAAPHTIKQAGDIQGEFDSAQLLNRLTGSMTEADILSNFFETEPLAAPIYRKEFLARSRQSVPAVAFRSLLEDLFYKAPRPAVYSRLPLDQAGNRAMNIKTDLLLSHIELHQATGLLRFPADSLSGAADMYYRARQRARGFTAQVNSLKQSLNQEIKKLEAIAEALARDRRRFEDPEGMKRSGDLLLANLANARVEGTTVHLIDYYDPLQREAQVEIDKGETLQQAAARYFSQYQKARRALTAIAARESSLSGKLQPLRELSSQLSAEPDAEQVARINEAIEKTLRPGGARPAPDRDGKKKRAGAIKDVGRRFKSSDGFEIVVGTNDRTNDSITFRVAKPQDLWLHAADYPGSHVVVRNPSRAAVPHRTVIEAAELAAFYSQAKRESKAAVHYTEKKFVSKPPKAKPGLVRLSSFKTLMVEPRCELERLN